MHGRRAARWAILAASFLLASPSARAQDLAFLDVPARPRSQSTPPTQQMRRGLSEMEGELTRFGSRSRGYRQTVDQLLQRRARSERRAVLQRYASALSDERRLHGAARVRAIRSLERFLELHPREPRHTPGALLRLAELYVERAIDRAGTERAPDLSGAVAVTRRLLIDFPGDARVDRAAYLLGWALGESGQAAESVAVWRSFVCANRYRYPAPAPPGPTDEEPPHPALAAGSSLPPSLARGPYADCRSARPSTLEAEMWLRMGEHHFDASELEAAISSYRRVLDHPDDRLFAFGLYKLAWSHYRAAHYAEAVERFSALVRYSDDVQRRTGAAGSELREEALQYLALTIAYDDWNEDGRPDHTQGGPHPLERLEDQSLWPHTASFAPDVYRRVGDVLYEMSHLDEAIVAWRLRLSSFNAGCDLPDVYLSLVRAQRQLGDEDAALATLDELAGTVGRPGWNGATCPAGAARAHGLVRRALVETARLHHRRAQALRERAQVEDDTSLRARARQAYASAERVYARVLSRFPNHPDAYGVAYDRAEALYWSGRYGEAARAYAGVRDSPFDDCLFARAARRVVEALGRQQEASTPERTTLRAEPPLVDGQPRPASVPEALQPAARAREIYVRWVRPSEDVERVRDAYAFNNARLLYLYGHWGPARVRFRRLFEAHCRGPNASDVGRDAWRALQSMALSREALGELEELTTALRRRGCTFAPEGPAVLAEGCEGDGFLACEVPDLEARVRFRRLRGEADVLAAVTPAPARRRRAEQLAARLLQTVDRAPEHPQAPPALLLAARLLDQQAQRPASATRVYQRIVDDVAPQDGSHDAVVAEAHFQLARAAQRSFDYERALASYATIVESDRFARSSEGSMAQRRRDALVNAALLTARLGRHAQAARAWARAAEVLPASEAREARLRAAEEALEAGQAAEARVALRRWLDGGRTVQALARLAQAEEALGHERARLAALRDAVRIFEADRGAASSADRALAARAALEVARAGHDGLQPSPIAPGQRPSLDAFVRALRADVAREATRVAPLVRAYEQAIGIAHADSSVTALERQGQVYEQLVRTVLGARFTLPRDVARRVRRASPDVREHARQQLEDAVHASLDEMVRPLECRAIERYALSTRLASRAGLPTLSAQRAMSRLMAYGEERVRHCLDEAHRRDPTFDGYRPRELERARRGLHLAPPEGVAPGPLARLD